jgi:Transposase DDE domain
MVERNGIPVAATVSAANVNDISQLLPTVVACPHPKFGEPGHQPASLQGDRAYHSKDHEDLLRRMDITPVIAHRGQPHGSGLGTSRYVVERTIAAVHHNRRLKLRYEKRPELHTAFLTLACIKLCWYRLDPKRKKTR